MRNGFCGIIPVSKEHQIVQVINFIQNMEDNNTCNPHVRCISIVADLLLETAIPAVWQF